MARIDAIREVQITKQTFYRWRKRYGGMGTAQLKELKRLQRENERLRKAVSDLTFDQLIPFYGFRHTIPPGISGWAQVMYGYAASDDQTRAKLEFDFYYIKHMSAWLDLVVLVKTVRTIILGSGAR